MKIAWRLARTPVTTLFNSVTASPPTGLPLVGIAARLPGYPTIHRLVVAPVVSRHLSVLRMVVDHEIVGIPAVPNGLLVIPALKLCVLFTVSLVA